MMISPYACSLSAHRVMDCFSATVAVDNTGFSMERVVRLQAMNSRSGYKRIHAV